jgi:hypothetical protein
MNWSLTSTAHTFTTGNMGTLSSKFECSGKSFFFWYLR